MEREAIDRIFGELSAFWHLKAKRLWKEYEERKTQEAKLVCGLDKIQPLIQRLASEDRSLIDRKITYQRLDETKPKEVGDDELLSKIWERLLKETKERKLVL